MKHAWPAHQAGKLAIELRTRGAIREVRIVDDGVGYKKDDVAPGLGTQIARALAKEAQVEMETRTKLGDGTAVILRLA